MACKVFDRDSNLETAGRLVQEASERGAQLILLPEYFPTGCRYDPRIREFGEPIGGPTTQWMVDWSQRTDCWIGGGMIESAGGRLFNTFVLASPDGETWCYRKRYPAFFENLYFHRGHAPGLFETPIGRIGVMICWDMVHSRLITELAGQCDLLLISAAWPDMVTGNIPLLGFQDWLSRQHWGRPAQLAQRLGVPVVFCNVSGTFVTRVPGLGVTYRSKFAGGSAIFDPTGQTLAMLGWREGTVVASVEIGPGCRTSFAA